MTLTVNAAHSATTEQPLRTQIDRVESKLGGLRAQSARGRRGALRARARSASNTGSCRTSASRSRSCARSALRTCSGASAPTSAKPSASSRRRCANGSASSREQVRVIEEKRQALLDDIKQGQDVLASARGRPVRGPRGRGRAAPRMDRRARDRPARRAPAAHAVVAARRGRSAVPQVSAARRC